MWVRGRVEASKELDRKPHRVERQRMPMLWEFSGRCVFERDGR